MQSVMSSLSGTQRKTVACILLVTIAIMSSLVWFLEPLIILVRKNDSLFRPEVPFVNGDGHPTTSASFESGNNMVPRILHQTYATDRIPDNWEASQQSCKLAYADFEYMVRRYQTRPLSTIVKRLFNGMVLLSSAT